LRPSVVAQRLGHCRARVRALQAQGAEARTFLPSRLYAAQMRATTASDLPPALERALGDPARRRKRSAWSKSRSPDPAGLQWDNAEGQPQELASWESRLASASHLDLLPPATRPCASSFVHAWAVGTSLARARAAPLHHAANFSCHRWCVGQRVRSPPAAAGQPPRPSKPRTPEGTHGPRLRSQRHDDVRAGF